MNEPSTLTPELRKISHAASAWLVKRDRGFTPGEQDEFFAWLAADPRHGEWFARHQRTWKEFDLLAQWRPEHAGEPNPELLARPRTPFRSWQPWAMVFAAAAALALAFIAFRPVAPLEDLGAPNSMYRSRVLEDGTTIGLRDDSEVLVRYTATERKVDLVRGEAFFSVAKNPDRPFIVHANGVDVRAVGTAFNVRLGAAQVEVLVTEGRVAVREQGTSVHPPDVKSTGQPSVPAGSAAEILVTAGERAIVALAGTTAPIVASVPEAEITRALAWQPNLFDFDSAPLAEVVAEFNQRNRTQLVVADESLRDLPIVASFRSDNVEGFVRLLELTAGVRAERRGDAIILRAER